jgi:hypothetical protein
LREEEQPLRGKLSALAEERVRLLLSDDDKSLAAIDQRARDLHLDLEKIEVAIPEFEKQLQALTERETEASKQRRYDEAATSLVDAEKRVLAEYPKLIGGVLKLIELAAEAMLQVERANENLPSGESPIVLPQMFGGQMPSKPEVIRSRQVVEKWTFEATGKIVNAERDVVTTGAGRGVLEGASQNQPVLLRRFEEITFNPVESQSWNAAFFEMLRLPKLDGSEAAIWRGGADTPDALLEEVRQALSNLRNKPAQRPRPVQTRLEPL